MFRPNPSVPALRDARWFQIAGQSAILAVGLLAQGFGISPAQIATAIGVSLAVQWLGSILIASRFDWKSPLISGLSLSLLLRADSLWPFALAAALSIGSKFAIRAGDRHVFNPANFGIVLMVGLSGAAWTSTGEWGGAPWFAAMIAALGAVTCWRASRLDAPIIYLAVFASLVVGRALYLGDPLSIPALRLSHGALILFAFFMISDPVTTPMDRGQRAIFVSAAAVLAYIGQFHFFISDAIFYAPFAIALLRLFIGDAGAGARYEWGAAPRPLRFIFHTEGRTGAPAE
jgi:Na+-transporting NADH:ubiquinone oxidoreductase subunit NqrB